MFNSLLNKTINEQSIILIKRQLCYCIVQQWSLKMWPLFIYVVYTTLYKSCRFHLMFIMSLLRSITCGHRNIKQAHALNWVTVDTTCPPFHRLSTFWNLCADLNGHQIHSFGICFTLLIFNSLIKYEFDSY